MSWTMGTEFEPLFCLRVVGTPEEGGNIRSSFDYYRVRSSLHDGSGEVPCLICGMMMLQGHGSARDAQAHISVSTKVNECPKYFLPTFFIVPDSLDALLVPVTLVICRFRRKQFSFIKGDSFGKRHLAAY